MSRPPSVLFVVAISLTLPIVPLLAHHSFAAEYDSTKPIDISGVVTKVEWTNPHVYFYIDTKGADGKTTNVAVENGSPNVLRRMRWGKNSIRIGDALRVSGYRAKKAANTVNAVTVRFPDGTSLFAGSSSDAELPPKAK